MDKNAPAVPENAFPLSGYGVPPRPGRPARMRVDHPEWTEHRDEGRQQTPGKVLMERHTALSQVEDCQQGHPQHTHSQEHPHYSRRDEHIFIVTDFFLERKFRNCSAK
jgi:hypothetical protein